MIASCVACSGRFPHIPGIHPILALAPASIIPRYASPGNQRLAGRPPGTKPNQYSNKCSIKAGADAPHRPTRGSTGAGTPYGVKAERRARRQTALRLIAPVEYASAEALCEGDAYRIACELDVTLQVVRDYQDMLHDTIRM